MRISLCIQVTCLVFVFAAPVSAQELPIPVADALQRAEIPLAASGMYVQEVGDAPALVASNDMAPFNPASTMKLVTSNAALEILGPTYAWKTQAYATGAMQGDVLRGDLIIKGSGDPKLVLENFWLFLRRIRARGIREIQGNVLLDRSFFEDRPHDAAAFDGDPAKPYNVGPDALLLNYKALGFRFTPDPATRSVQVTIDPPLAPYNLAAPRLTNGDCGAWRAGLRAIIDPSGAYFPGTMSASCGEKIWYVHPFQMTHTQYFSLVFRKLWADMGGVLRGEIRNGMLSPAAQFVAEWESASLAEIIRDINKYSNNVMARQLLLTLAANVTRLPATPENGGAVVRTWLGNKGIDAPELSIDNGSGLSRTERISARTMGRMLVEAYRSPTMPEFISSLPLVAYDGTMRSRLVNQTVAGKAHIKTGSLNEVRSVAGYVLAASGKRYVVVCLINHPNAERGRDAQDALLQWVYEKG